MKYSKLVEIYEELSKTSKGLEKIQIISKFLENIEKDKEVIYLLQGRFYPDYDERESGVSDQLVIKAISRASGIESSKVINDFRKTGDLGKSVENLLKNKQQSSLFHKELTTERVINGLRKLPELEGKGTVDKKMDIIIELLHSASSLEAKYLVRTLLNDLKIGVGSGILRDALVNYCFKPETIEEKKIKGELVQSAYDKLNDFAEVFEKSLKGEKELEKVDLLPGRPVKVMLYVKAKNISDAFEVVGKPAAFEYKYDGFRMMINKDEKGEINIFTRRLDNVTKQFPDVVRCVRENVSGKSFIIDGEAIGYDPKNGKHRPFQDISQRIKRKYDIEKLEKELPIELKVFDVVYYNGQSLLNEHFLERRKILEKIIKSVKLKINLAEQIVSDDESKVELFYQKALEDGQEGLMGKNLNAIYKPGARVGYGVKIKPEANELDLVITGAEYGNGKRAGWLTSFDVSCRSGDKLLEVGKVSTGLKEKEEEGLSFVELTNLLKKIIVKNEGKHVIVKPEVILTVGYQDIQKSPSYSSGYALRFPRVISLRVDKGIKDIAKLEEISQEL